MPSPFPGMDPWLENPEGWTGVHARMITRSSDFLQPQLNSLGYFVDIEERIYIEESERTVVPDLVVVDAQRTRPATGVTHAAVLEADVPMLVRSISDEEIKERSLQIFSRDNKQLVTQIEIISHSNKQSKTGRELYIRKRRELLSAEVNVVEIDLLRAGNPIVDLDRRARKEVGPCDYLVSVVRHGQIEHEVYAIQLRERLPRIRVPLRDESPDVVLDLQLVFEQVYASGPYRVRIEYDSPPIPPLSSSDQEWADAILHAAGLRTAK